MLARKVQNSTILIMCDTYPLLLWKIKSQKQRSHTKDDDDDDVKQNRKSQKKTNKTNPGFL